MKKSIEYMDPFGYQFQKLLKSKVVKQHTFLGSTPQGAKPETQQAIYWDSLDEGVGPPDTLPPGPYR